ncbi:hypothetical protein GO001_04720 [Streptomyces sp. NRRL B-1677]|uniref:hypothetical protein n=1 Tax=Streptomyces sp. NRRL B-1677 TaxID=2682966 RepID=UPI0018929904|nr:hypothetical protein [Streptomyces sp. NRRL B-1677]MBF6044527.1 hypothetical protein [Streptomyces sp. NRRL B-1677]
MTLVPKRRLPRAAAAAALLTAATVSLLLSVPAAAKGAMEITAPGRPLRTGQALHISGDGDDDAAAYLRACVQERTLGAGPWRTVGCGPTVASGDGATVETLVRARRRGALQLRGVLYGLDAPGDAHPDVVRSSAVRMVRIH